MNNTEKIIGKAIAHKSNKENDNLPTPYSATFQIIKKFGKDNIQGYILEPCCGINLAIVKVLEHFYGSGVVEYYDKIWNPDKYNFLKENKKTNFIFTNPPFSKWDLMVQKSRSIATDGFIFIGKLEFLTGINRYNDKLYYPGGYNLKVVYNFTRQCDWRVPLRKDGTYPAGMSHYAAYYFKNGYTGKAEIDFINNNPFIKK